MKRNEFLHLSFLFAAYLAGCANHGSDQTKTGEEFSGTTPSPFDQVDIPQYTEPTQVYSSATPYRLTDQVQVVPTVPDMNHLSPEEVEDIIVARQKMILKSWGEVGYRSALELLPVQVLRSTVRVRYRYWEPVEDMISTSVIIGYNRLTGIGSMFIPDHALDKSLTLREIRISAPEVSYDISKIPAADISTIASQKQPKILALAFYTPDLPFAPLGKDKLSMVYSPDVGQAVMILGYPKWMETGDTEHKLLPLLALTMNRTTESGFWFADQPNTQGMSGSGVFTDNGTGTVLCGLYEGTYVDRSVIYALPDDIFIILDKAEDTLHKQRGGILTHKVIQWIYPDRDNYNFTIDNNSVPSAQQT